MELTQNHFLLWTLVLVVLSQILLPYNIGKVLSTSDAVCFRKL